MENQNIKKVFHEFYKQVKVFNLDPIPRKALFLVSGLYPAYWIIDAIIHFFIESITLWVTLQMLLVALSIFIIELGLVELFLWIRAELKDL